MLQSSKELTNVPAGPGPDSDTVPGALWLKTIHHHFEVKGCLICSVQRMCAHTRTHDWMHVVLALCALCEPKEAESRTPSKKRKIGGRAWILNRYWREGLKSDGTLSSLSMHDSTLPTASKTPPQGFSIIHPHARRREAHLLSDGKSQCKRRGYKSKVLATHTEPSGIVKS